MNCRFRSGTALGGATFAVACFASLTLLIAGCGGEKSPVSPRRAARRDLPTLGEYMVPLNDGRLQVAPPRGWEIGSRKTGYVIWFKKSRESAYPCILISAEDYDETPTVTDKNVKQFASEIRDRLEKSGKSAGGVAPLEVDAFRGASYRRVGKTKQKFKVILLNRLIVQTAVDGQLYTFELRSPQEEFADVKDAVLAVAAGAKFPESETKAPLVKKPAAEKPAGEERSEEVSRKPVADGTKEEKAETATKKPGMQEQTAPSKKTTSPQKEPSRKKIEPPKKKPAKTKAGDSEFELLDDDEL